MLRVLASLLTLKLAVAMVPAAPVAPQRVGGDLVSAGKVVVEGLPASIWTDSNKVALQSPRWVAGTASPRPDSPPPGRRPRRCNAWLTAGECASASDACEGCTHTSRTRGARSCPSGRSVRRASTSCQLGGWGASDSSPAPAKSCGG